MKVQINVIKYKTGEVHAEVTHRDDAYLVWGKDGEEFGEALGRVIEKMIAEEEEDQ